MKKISYSLLSIYFILTIGFPTLANDDILGAIPTTQKRFQELKKAESTFNELEPLTPELSSDQKSKIQGTLQWLATKRSFAGDSVGAIESFDTIYQGRKPKIASLTEEKVSIENSTATNALSAIIEEAKKRQIVILNEAHHVSMHRAFAMILARELRKIGYEYLACETFLAENPNPLSDGFVSEESGFYLNEPMFANFLRDSIKNSWKFVSYESIRDPKLTNRERQQIRESNQAKNLYEKILKNNPNAKIFIYVGYGHLQKFPEAIHDTDDSMMAAQLKRLTGIDPLTIDQTTFFQHKESQRQIELYKFALDKQIDSQPFVLKTLEKEYLKFEYRKSDIDIQIVHPSYSIDPETKRPSWLKSIAGFRPKEIPLSLLPQSGKRLIYAFPFDAPPNSVPADLVIVEAGKPAPKLMLPEGKYRLTYED